MNKLYSVSPEMFSNATEVGVVLNAFGFDKGRFIAALPKSFIREIFESTAGFSELEIKRVRALVERNKHLILKPGLDYDRNMSWLENSLELIKKQQLQGAITTEAGDVTSKQVYTLHDVADGDLPVSDGVRKHATPENMLQCMSVVLETSQEVFLIDPYFSLGKAGCVKFLQALVQSHHSKDTSYIIFCKKEHFETRESFESLAQRHLQTYMAPGCSITVYPLENQTEMHGRYVFNIYGGVDYDKGFQVDESVRVDFSAMPKGLHSSYFDQYSELMKKEPAKYSYCADQSAAIRMPNFSRA